MREHFHVPDNYFLSHSVGCLPRRTLQDLNDHLFAKWQTKGGNAWPGWMDVLDTYRAHLAAMFGTSAAQICPQTNVSSALTKILYSLPLEDGRKTILCTTQDFPTVGYVFKQAERAGFTLRFVNGDVCDPAVWEDAMDDTVGVVHITHAFSNTSRLAPVAEICALARASGALSIVDVAQSAGAVAIDLPIWDADFAIGTGVKFLCCGPGACFLYASHEMIEICQPLDVGWFSHEDPFEMDIHDFRFANSAMRFFGGTPSPAPLIMANAALAVWAEIAAEQGQGAVEARIQALLSKLVAALPVEMMVSPALPGHRGGALVVVPADRAALHRALAARHIQYDERSEGFRFSVHGYTSDAEIDVLIGALQNAG